MIYIWAAPASGQSPVAGALYDVDLHAQEFEPGLRYEEADVNFRLQLFYPDYAALRRYLVDEGMMNRAEGVYWRTGGRYDNGNPVIPAADAGEDGS